MGTGHLQKREIFHLSFLRFLAQVLPPSSYALKGGCNLRFFFESVRYSEDIDLDVWDVPVHVLRDKVMAVLSSPSFAETLRVYGVTRIELPDIRRAKQTETIQRFKLRLVSSAGEELATRIEFSRRGHDPDIAAEGVSAPILAAYRMAPLIVPHYLAATAIRQKIRALAGRREAQARDVFDLFLLSSRPASVSESESDNLRSVDLDEVRERIFAMDYRQYRDTVLDFLGPEDQAAYESRTFWDEIRLQAVLLIERAVNGYE